LCSCGHDGAGGLVVGVWVLDRRKGRGEGMGGGGRGLQGFLAGEGMDELGFEEVSEEGEGGGEEAVVGEVFREGLLGWGC